MAISNRNERACCLAFALPMGRVLPDPDSIIDSADRQHLAFSWRAIFAGVYQKAALFYRYFRNMRQQE